MYYLNVSTMFGEFSVSTIISEFTSQDELSSPTSMLGGYKVIKEKNLLFCIQIIQRGVMDEKNSYSHFLSFLISNYL